MSKLTENNRRESTLVRDKEVCRIYNQILNELGELRNVVSKSYILQIKPRLKLKQPGLFNE